MGLLLIAQLAMLIILWVIACFIFLIIREKASCISICTALFAPAFAFMGITFPVNDMPLLAQWWRLIMPSSHYIDSHVGIVSYGEALPQLLTQLGSYWIFLPLIPLIFILSRFAVERSSIEPEGGQ